MPYRRLGREVLSGLREGDRGIYRLQQKGFALWIKTFHDNQQKLPLQDQDIGADDVAPTTEGTSPKPKTDS